MPNYSFKGYDIKGFEQEGVVVAANAQEAAKQIAAGGIRVRMVQEVKASAPVPTPVQPTPVAQPAPASPAASVQRPSRAGAARPTPAPAPRPTAPQTPPPGTQFLSAPSTPRSRPTPTAVTPRQPQALVHTAMGTDKDRTFLFGQFAAGLRAGINPADFLNGVAPRTRGIFQESLHKMAEAATEGIPMSNVMERYPDLYPPHVPAMIRAGEIGGFLPEACESISQQAEQAHKFNRFFSWVWFVLLNFAISIPGIFLVRQASNNYLDELNKTGGAMSKDEALSSFLGQMWQMCKWPYGPLTLGGYLLCWVLWRYYLGSNTRALRHEVGLHWPSFGARARAENLTMFAWTMSKLARAGLPHAEAWNLASRAVPNMAVSKRLADLGTATGRERPISLAFQESKLFPPEFASVAATGEMTGDLGSAMDQLAKMSRVEFESAQNFAKIRGAAWGVLGCAVTSAIMVGVMAWWWFHEVPDKVLGEDNPLK